VKLVFLTMNPDPAMAREALRIGPLGYILKTSPASELAKAIRESAKGRRYVTPLLEKALGEAWIEDHEGKKLHHILSPRQREVLELLAQGQTMKQVADLLHLARRTMAFHKYRDDGGPGNQKHRRAYPIRDYKPGSPEL
jgi:DNA-binding NarL/FixJ family response regulator